MFLLCSGPNKKFYESLKIKEIMRCMKADEVSKTAMNDMLICSYANMLFDKKVGLAKNNSISNRMRELGRLLLEIRGKKPVERLIDVLKPDCFTDLVEATKTISGYDETTGEYYVF